MKSVRNLLAPIFLTLVIGVPAWAGEVNSPPTTPQPPPHSTITLKRVADDSTYTKDFNAPVADNGSINMDAATFAINLLVSMLSIY